MSSEQLEEKEDKKCRFAYYKKMTKYKNLCHLFFLQSTFNFTACINNHKIELRQKNVIEPGRKC
ncbi:hypothetical protein SAMN03080606_02320 [Alkaliphilus peptidifermentans DSM 18978]|uniref:Uncharacterized protein n=1 Tax=Alkaliphilus peptidifermentans DSM 18978 TaxID=1120976 RepID=A0A1G5ICD5_9FIRM|nr:hypothetical protein SAMN03080606_02320 [Alkaliphilus peptidifermentans DSM 18978]